MYFFSNFLLYLDIFFNILSHYIYHDLFDFFTELNFYH